MRLSPTLLEAIFHTVEALPPHSIENIASVLEAEVVYVSDVRPRLLHSVALSHERLILTTLVDIWLRETPLPPPPMVAAGLRGAAHTRSAMHRQQTVELVWTGPSAGTTLRRIDQALLQVIQSARRELLLVTFAAYRLPLLMDALRAAAHRGVIIRFVAETAEDDGGKVHVDPRHAFADIAHLMQVFRWPIEKRQRDPRGHTGTLHAKCALADDTMLLLSSANLTDSAMLLNMEMGLLVTGGDLPSGAYAHFQHLINQHEIIE